MPRALKKPSDVSGAFEKNLRSIHIQWESTGKQLKYMDKVIAERNTATNQITFIDVKTTNHSSAAAIRRIQESIKLFKVLNADGELLGSHLTKPDAIKAKRLHSNNGTLVIKIEPMGESV